VTALQWVGLVLAVVCLLGLIVLGPWYGAGNGDR
jgi:hypothetical protein